MLKCKRCGRDIYKEVVDEFGLDYDYHAYENDLPFRITTDKSGRKLVLELDNGVPSYKVELDDYRPNFRCPHCGKYPFKTLREVQTVYPPSLEKHKLAKEIYNSFREEANKEFKKSRALIKNGETHLDNLAEGFVEADRILQKIVKERIWSVSDD